MLLNVPKRSCSSSLSPSVEKVECSGCYCKSSIASGSAQDILLMKKRDGFHLLPSIISIIIIHYNLPTVTLMKVMGTAHWYSYTIPHTFQCIFTNFVQGSNCACFIYLLNNILQFWVRSSLNQPYTPLDSSDLNIKIERFGSLKIFGLAWRRWKSSWSSVLIYLTYLT